MSSVNLELVGVGGQGILTSSQVIGEAALEKGLDVFMSEVHGMSQRGGVVVTTVKIGDEVYSPLIGDGEAEVLLGFEPIETYRAIKKASKDSWVITNTSPIVPFTVTVGNSSYPEVDEILGALENECDRFISVDAAGLAKEAGASITQNIVLIGSLTATGVLPMTKEEMLESMRKNVPEKSVDMNTEAFKKGFDAVKEQKD